MNEKLIPEKINRTLSSVSMYWYPFHDMYLQNLTFKESLRKLSKCCHVMMSVSDKWSVRWELENERISQTRGHKSFLSSGLITIMDTPTERDSQGREKILYMGITFILFSGVKQHHKLETVKIVCKQYWKIFQRVAIFLLYLSDTCIVIYTFYLLHGNIIKT